MLKLILTVALIFTFSCTKKRKLINQLNVSTSSAISTLDPANSYDTVSARVIYQSYEQLFEYDYLKRPYSLRPLLAVGLPKISEDRLTYTIEIKKGVFYQDHGFMKGKNRELKAQDFITQFKRMAFKGTRSPGWWLFEDKVKGLDKFRFKAGTKLEKLYSLNISGLTAVDNYTLKIQLKKPFPQFMFALSMSFSSPIPMEAVKHFKNDLTNDMVATGPYILTDWKKNLNLTLTKNPKYRKALYPAAGDRYAIKNNLLDDKDKQIPFIDTIKIQILKESQTAWLNFMAGKLDIMNLPKDNFDSVITPMSSLTDDMKKKGIVLAKVSSLTFWFISFNMRDSIFAKNRNLRLAIAHAVDTDKLIKVFTNNVGLKANSIYPPGIFGYNPSVQLPYGYNSEKAKEFLKKAGYPEGKGLPEIEFDVRGSSTRSRQMADFYRQELSKVGVKIKVVTNTFPGFLKKLKNGKLTLWQGGWAMDYPDSENVLQLLSNKNLPPGPNGTSYTNSKFQKLFEQAIYMEDTARKNQLLREIEDIVNKDIPWVMQYYARNYILRYNRVKNYRSSDIIYNNYKYLRLDDSAK
jgi:oligopeptide transport system substrate-binding protein